MVTGVSGVNGVPAVRHANKENTPEVANATHQLQSMVGRNAKGNPAKFKPAMKRFHAQVSLINILHFSAALEQSYFWKNSSTSKCNSPAPNFE